MGSIAVQEEDGEVSNSESSDEVSDEEEVKGEGIDEVKH